ncbi:MAG: asparaginase [Gemmatimonadetes bacterium]|nr:asparaginase [Gemmatimonadota bacterium]
MNIRILVTGGTFDKEYNELNGTLHFHHTYVEHMLERGRCRLEMTVEVLMMKDSLEMTDADRARIVHECSDCDEARIVITHGTDTMVETARTLAAKVAGKTVVLTGAMIPIAFGSSDGLFNLGGAITAVQALPAGVYITMNGRIFPWDRVRKNRSTGVFEEVE